MIRNLSDFVIKELVGQILFEKNNCKKNLVKTRSLTERNNIKTDFKLHIT